MPTGKPKVRSPASRPSILRGKTTVRLENEAFLGVNQSFETLQDNRDRVTSFMWSNGRNDPNVYFAKQ